MAEIKGKRNQQDPLTADEDVQVIEPVTKKRRRANVNNCGLCYETKPADQFPNDCSSDYPPDCKACVWAPENGWVICYACISHCLTEAVYEAETKRPGEIECMNCDNIWPQQYVRLHLSSEDREAYDRSLLRWALRDTHDFRWCPAPGCGAGFIHERTGDKCRKITCVSCQGASCYYCNTVWQTGHNCRPHRRMSQETLEVLREQETHQCPRCGIAVIKNGGCDHMNCENCGRNFSWDEAKPIGEGDKAGA